MLIKGKFHLPLSISKSSFLPEVTITYLSLYTTSDTLKAEICLAVKCVTFHYSQGSMNELTDLLAIIFRDFQMAGNITLGLTTLPYFINYGFEKYFLVKCMGLVKNVSHLLSI